MNNKKKCSRCKQLKDKSEFHKNSWRQDGLKGECKECVRIQGKKYYQKHKEQRRQYFEEYYPKNKDKYRLGSQRWSAKNRQHKKVHRDKIRFSGNREGVLARDKHTCQVCGKHTNIVHHKDGSGIRTKNPTALFPDDSMENLITLCKSCHCKIHMERRLCC